MCEMKAVEEFRARALNPEHPQMRGSHENGDIFFQHREACNSYYTALPAVVEKYMDKINAKLGTNYGLFNYYGAEDADRVIVAMGSICDVAEEVIDYLNAHGEKVGLVKVRLFRPFAPEHQGARRSGRAPVSGCGHLSGQRRPQRHPGHRRPLRSGQQGHASCLRVRRV